MRLAQHTLRHGHVCCNKIVNGGIITCSRRAAGRRWATSRTACATPPSGAARRPRAGEASVLAGAAALLASFALAANSATANDAAATEEVAGPANHAGNENDGDGDDGPDAFDFRGRRVRRPSGDKLPPAPAVARRESGKKRRHVLIDARHQA